MNLGSKLRKALLKSIGQKVFGVLAASLVRVIYLKYAKFNITHIENSSALLK